MKDKWKKGLSNIEIFSISFLITIILHGTVLFNKISWHDDLLLLNGWNDSLIHGRWGYAVLYSFMSKLYGGESASIAIGIISALLIAISACISIYIFKIENLVMQIAMILIYSSIPVVMGNFGYMVTAGYNFMGIAMTFFSLLVSCKKPSIKSFLGASLILCWAIGEYQHNLTLYLTGALLLILSATLASEIDLLEFIKKSLYYLGIALLALGGYILILKLTLSYFKIQLTGYAGTDTYGIVDISGYYERIISTYREFFSPSSDTWFSAFPFEAIWINTYLFVLVVVVIWLFADLIRCKKYKQLLEIFIIILLIPIVFYFNFILYDYKDVHSLHVYNLTMLWILPFIIVRYLANCVEKWKLKDNNKLLSNIQKAGRNLTVVVATCAMLLGTRYFWYTSVGYMQLHMNMSRTLNYISTMISRIEVLDGYTSDMPIMYVGTPQPEGINYWLSNLPTNPYCDGFMVNSYMWSRYMPEYLGFNTNPIVYDESLLSTFEYLNMGTYPNANSIQIINNVIVVRFN